MSGEAIAASTIRPTVYAPATNGVAKVGALHSWRNAGAAPVRMVPDGPRSTQAARQGARHLLQKSGRGAGLRGAARPERTSRAICWGTSTESQIPARRGEHEFVAGLEGVFLKWSDRRAFRRAPITGCCSSSTSRASASRSTTYVRKKVFHPVGRSTGTLDGETYWRSRRRAVDERRLPPHVHHVSKEPVRWLETFAPIPPVENVFQVQTRLGQA